jgi:hypothetical protein
VNIVQRRIVATAGMLSLAIILYPPWLRHYHVPASSKITPSYFGDGAVQGTQTGETSGDYPAGHEFLWSPPSGECRVDITRLLLYLLAAVLGVPVARLVGSMFLRFIDGYLAPDSCDLWAPKELGKPADVTQEKPSQSA